MARHHKVVQVSGVDWNRWIPHFLHPSSTLRLRLRNSRWRKAAL